jgi:Bacterial Ig domain
MFKMKKVLSLLITVLVGLKGPLHAQTVSFNFSASAISVSGWVNVVGDPSVAVRTATAAGITVSSVATANWSAYEGVAAQNGNGSYPGTYYPPQVMSNNWFQYNGSARTLAEYNALVPQLQLSGLNPDSSYILRMSGSDGLGFVSTPTIYTVAGATVYGNQSLSVHNNLTQGVTFFGIYPNASGVISIYVNTTSSTDIASICGLQVFPGNAPVGTPAIAITSPATGAILSEGGNIVIQATASEAGATISKVEFYADTSKIGEVDAAPYAFTWVDPSPGSYSITAKATDNTGTVNNAVIYIGVELLNYFWSTTGNIATGGDTSFIGTVDSNRLAIRTKNIERLSILPTGNIGIGTKTPTAQFHTTGTVRLAGLTSDSTKTRVLVSDTSGNLFYRSATSLTGRWQYAGGVVYDSSDAIAIGTSNPQGYKLAVNGTAIFTKVKVKTAGTWPDYVFKKDYHLPNLKELEAYLSKYRHLPGIASEADVKKDGIDVGDEQAALLKKVEELTLYLIDENKALKQQNGQITEQKTTLEKQNEQLGEQKARMDKQQQEIDELKKLIREKK